MKCCNIILVACLVSGISVLSAKDYKARCYSKSVYGEYTLYNLNAQDFPKFPVGVEPIYDIYIGRHGSRYIEYNGMYTTMAELLGGAEKKDILTATGKQFWKWYKQIYPLLEGHEQQLTDKGRQQLASLAESIYKWLPHLFTGETQARVATSPTLRVIHSEEAFVQRLEQLDGDLRIMKDTLAIMKARPYSPILKKYNDIYEPQFRKKLDTRGFVSIFLTDSSYIKQFAMSEYAFTLYLRNIIAGVKSLDIKVPSGYKKCVSKKMHKSILDAINLATYFGLGRCPYSHSQGLDTYKETWKNVVKTAWKDIEEGNGVTLNLNFTHDIVVLNILAQLRAGTFGAEVQNLGELSNYWNCSYIPMACNLQMCICKLTGDHRLIVYPLLNGRSISLPLKEIVPGAYLWEEVARLNQ